MIQLNGVNFGPRAAAANITAWCSPTFSFATLRFYASSCSVIEDDVAIQCNTPSAVGSSLSWHVIVDGLESQVPTFGMDGPSITQFRVLSSSIP